MRQERGQDFQNDFSDASKSEIKNIGGGKQRSRKLWLRDTLTLIEVKI